MKRTNNKDLPSVLIMKIISNPWRFNSSTALLLFSRTAPSGMKSAVGRHSCQTLTVKLFSSQIFVNASQLYRHAGNRSAFTARNVAQSREDRCRRRESSGSGIKRE